MFYHGNNVFSNLDAKTEKDTRRCLSCLVEAVGLIRSVLLLTLKGNLKIVPIGCPADWSNPQWFLIPDTSQTEKDTRRCLSCLVEAVGFEPTSKNHQPKALHV